jgi:hypothetical protein
MMKTIAYYISDYGFGHVKPLLLFELQGFNDINTQLRHCQRWISEGRYIGRSRQN